MPAVVVISIFKMAAAVVIGIFNMYCSMFCTSNLNGSLRKPSFTPFPENYNFLESSPHLVLD